MTAATRSLLFTIARAAVAKAGGPEALAAALGRRSLPTHLWARIPAHLVADVSRLTGVPARSLRPDLA